MQKQDKPKEITLNFIKDINSRKKRIANFLSYKIIVNNKVFPVDSPFSYSSKITAKIIPKNVKSVLDVGTGTGVQAIVAAKRGAKKVLAIDIDNNCLKNANENIKYHKLDNIIKLRKSNLFEKIKPNEKFDLIISQLPFADVNYNCNVSHFLFDHNFKLHDRFLKHAKKHLTKNGKIIIPSGQIANEKKLIKLIKKYDYKILNVKETTYNKFVWKTYILIFK